MNSTIRDIIKYTAMMAIGFFILWIVDHKVVPFSKIIFSSDSYMWGNHVVVKDNDTTYSGDFLFGKFHGQGKYFTEDGNVYEGGWKNGKMDGNGRYTWTDGTVYDGEWKDGKKDGKGRYIWADGTVYDGEWKDDKKDGKGRYTWTDGSVYDGEWRDGKKDGKGIYFNKDGRYEGVYKDDLRDGRGVFITENGAKTELLYKRGELISSVALNTSRKRAGKSRNSDHTVEMQKQSPSKAVASANQSVQSSGGTAAAATPPAQSIQCIPVQVPYYCGVCGRTGRCSTCNGTGISTNGSAHICGACGGSRNCATCNGTGISGYYMEYRYY